MVQRERSEVLVDVQDETDEKRDRVHSGALLFGSRARQTVARRLQGHCFDGLRAAVPKTTSQNPVDTPKLQAVSLRWCRACERRSLRSQAQRRWNGSAARCADSGHRAPGRGGPGRQKRRVVRATADSHCLARRSDWRASSAGNRPMRTPFDLATSMPAMERSRMMLRSNSATAPSI